MQKFTILIGSILTLACVGCTSAPSEASKAASETKAADSKIKDLADIKAAYDKMVPAVKAKDINAIMAFYVPDESLLVFDAIPPRQYKGAAAYRKDWEGLLTIYPGDLDFSVADLEVNVGGDLAYATSAQHLAGKMKNGKTLENVVRVTDVFKRTGGQWLITHEHVSVPVDLLTGKADLMSKQ